MIAILLAAYNGEKYIAEQLDSIMRQSVQDFHVFVRDDASTDDTCAVVEAFMRRHPGKLSLERSGTNSGSAKHNFMELMLAHKAQYVMLCDQDDVWLPDKIERTLRAVRRAEAAHGAQTPLLVHTDLRVVDEQLREIHPSHHRAMEADCTRTALNQLIIQNLLTGCTAMYNRALAQRISAAPRYMVMHDWWLMLLAGAFGRIEYLPEATMLYRQHGGNEIGASDVRKLGYKLRRLLDYRKVKQAIDMTYPQAESLLTLYRDELNPKQIHILENYTALPNLSKVKRWVIICRIQSFKSGFARNIAYLLFV